MAGRDLPVSFIQTSRRSWGSQSVEAELRNHAQIALTHLLHRHLGLLVSCSLPVGLMTVTRIDELSMASMRNFVQVSGDVFAKPESWDWRSSYSSLRVLSYSCHG